MDLGTRMLIGWSCSFMRVFSVDQRESSRNDAFCLTDEKASCRDSYVNGEHKGRLHRVAVRWLMDRANPESQGGLGMFADTRFCCQLEKLLKRVERSAKRRVK